MRDVPARWFISGLILLGVVLGAGLEFNDFLSITTVRFGNLVNADFSLISNGFLTIVVVLGLARYLVVVRERQWGVQSGEEAKTGIGDWIFGLGPTGGVIADVFTAWTGFTTALAILATLFTGQLATAVPNLPLEGRISLGLMMAALLGLSGWIVASLLISTFGSPVCSASTTSLVTGRKPKAIPGTVVSGAVPDAIPAAPAASPSAATMPGPPPTP